MSSDEDFRFKKFLKFFKYYFKRLILKKRLVNIFFFKDTDIELGLASFIPIPTII